MNRSPSGAEGATSMDICSMTVRKKKNWEAVKIKKIKTHKVSPNFLTRKGRQKGNWPRDPQESSKSQLV